MKPGNILVPWDTYVLLCDLGSAHTITHHWELNESTEESQAGAFRYKAPPKS